MRAAPATAWHWGRCTACGEPIYVKDTDLVFDKVTAECCGATPENFGGPIDLTKAHPADHAPGMRCLTCGYEKEFGAPPAGAQGDGEMKKKEKAPRAHGVGSKDAANGKPIATLGEAMKIKRTASEPVERKRYRQQLPVRIDVETAHAKGAELARVCRERKEFEDEVAEINRGHRERIKYFKERIEELRIEVEQATVMKDVECADVLLPTNEVQTVRCDTGEVLKVRPARADELQESLLMAAAEAEPKAKGKKKKASAEDIEPPFGSPAQEPAPEAPAP